MARIHRLETEVVAEEGAVRFRIFAVNNDMSATDHLPLLHNASPTKKSTGLKTGHYTGGASPAPTTSLFRDSAGLKPGLYISTSLTKELPCNDHALNLAR